MTLSRDRAIGIVAALAGVLAWTVVVHAAPPQQADALIVELVRARLGADAEITVASLDLPARAGQEFRSARLDPAARLGKPMRVTFVPVSGTPVIAVVSLHVVVPNVVARRDLSRGETIADDDVIEVRTEAIGAPLRRLPRGTQVIGRRVLRPVPAGAVILPGAVVVRRTIERGDPVTVVARAGDAEVTASMVAADGGNEGDVIRVTNPDTRRDLRARVIKEGHVEVIHAR